MKPTFSALARQAEIYIKGVSGQRPKVPLDWAKLEAKAKEWMSPEGFTYVNGGAGLEHTIKNNRDGFGEWQIVPRMLRDVSTSDASLELFGQTLPSPILLAPVGVLEMAHRKADLAVGKAAADLGVPMIFSNQASVPMEKVAAIMGDTPRWFQLYWSKSRELVTSLVQRAEACGCSAIVVTLDTTMLGWRIQDLDLAYFPFLRGKGIAQYTSDPVFQRLVDEPDEIDTPIPKRRLTFKTIASALSLIHAYPGSFFKNLTSGRPLKAVRKFIRIYNNPALNWDDLPFLREKTKLPILLKGILHPEDARKALDYGVNGLIVSNHGGRQVDGSISTIKALPGVVDAVNGQIPILIDSGIRGGADIFKALSLGAKAVCIGRPYAYGLAIDGQRGVSAVLKNLMADFELTMRLSGYQSLKDLNRDCLVTGR